MNGFTSITTLSGPTPRLVPSSTWKHSTTQSGCILFWSRCLPRLRHTYEQILISSVTVQNPLALQSPKNKRTTAKLSYGKPYANKRDARPCWKPRAEGSHPFGHLVYLCSGCLSCSRTLDAFLLKQAKQTQQFSRIAFKSLMPILVSSIWKTQTEDLLTGKFEVTIFVLRCDDLLPWIPIFGIIKASIFIIGESYMLIIL